MTFSEYEIWPKRSYIRNKLINKANTYSSKSNRRSYYKNFHSTTYSTSGVSNKIIIQQEESEYSNNWDDSSMDWNDSEDWKDNSVNINYQRGNNYKKVRNNYMDIDESEDNTNNIQESQQSTKSTVNNLETIELDYRKSFDTSKLIKYSKNIIDNDNININILKQVYSSVLPEEFIEIIGYMPCNIVKSFLEDKSNIDLDDIYNYISIGYTSSFIRDSLRRKKEYLTRFITDDEIIDDNEYMFPAFINGKANNKFIHRDLTDTEKSHLSFPLNKNINIQVGAVSIIKNITWFKRNLKAFSGGSIEDITLYNGTLGGSCVTSCLQRLPFKLEKLHREIDSIEESLNNTKTITPENESNTTNIRTKKLLKVKLDKLNNELQNYYNNTNPESDIDIFFHGNNYKKTFNSLKLVYEQITNNLLKLNHKWKLVRTHNAITICVGSSIRNIQLILLITQTIPEQLLFADLDCTANIYNGINVYTCERAVRAFNTKWNFVPPGDLGNLVGFSRVIKYTKRGFGSLLYETCKHFPRCDVIPTSKTKYLLYKLEKQYQNPIKDDSFISYNASWTLDDIMNNLDKTGYQYEYLPWLIGDTLSDIILPQDINILDTVNTLHDFPLDYHETIKRLKTVRWKQVSEIRRHKKLMPRCYMCKGSVLYQIESSINGKIVPICNKCKEINEKYRNQRVNLSGRIALVTGGRIKIGYAIVLKLLRDGALVISTTRFPYDACKRLQNEPDYNEWKDRIHIYGIDFRNLTSVQEFISHIKKSYDKLDILINNAAQTIHRPPAYYENVASSETSIHQSLENNPTLQVTYKAIKDLNSNPFLLTNKTSNLTQENDKAIIPSHCGNILPSSIPSLSSPLFSSQYTLIPVLPSDHITKEEKEQYFPLNKVDEHNEPADLRPKNSWNTVIEETHPIELIEVQLVNSAVPTMLISQFTDLLIKGAEKEPGAFVVNVSSAEGQFAAPKYNGHHVHTNMAKAALNMLTRTIADEMHKKCIHVTSVDTGWVTKMTPGGIQNKQTSIAPLSPEDGAARVLYPIYTFQKETKEYPIPVGILYKDFKPAPW